MSLSAPQCWACRRRRVRCDAEKPTCQKCKAKGLECPGYGETKPLVWVKGPNARKRRKKPQENPVISTTSPHSPSNASNGSVEYVVRTKTPERDLAVMKQSSFNKALQSFGSDYLPPETANVAKCVEYYNRYICGTMAPISTTSNPFRISPQFWHYMPPMTLDMFVLVVARHRLIRSEYSPGRIERTESMKALEYDISKRSASAISQLNKRLSTVQTQTDDMTLICVFVLLMSEIQRCSVGTKWKMHLEGTRAIFHLRGGVESLLQSRTDPVRNLITFFILADFMRLTTLDVRKEPTAVDQIKYLSLIPAVFNDGVWTSMPCPEELLRYIVRINDLRLRSAMPTSWLQLPAIQSEARELAILLSRFDQKEWSSSAMDILEMAPRITPSQWNTRLMPMALSRPHIYEEASSRTKERRMWTCLANVYQAAVTIYLIRSVLLLHFSPDTALMAPSTTTIEQLRVESLQKLHSNFDQLFGTRNCSVQYYLFCFWPLFIDGLETSATDVKAQSIIQRRLKEIAVMLGFHSVIDASEFLDRYWKRQSVSGEGIQSWNGIFEWEPPCLFVL